jgi:DNA transposition AAA+ family ATPase
VSLHLPGLEDEATIVPTPAFGEVRDRLAFATRHRATMLVAGARGTGKRVALLTALDQQPLPYLVVDTPPAASPTEITRVLHQAVHQDRDVLDLREMQDELVDTLRDRECVLAIAHAEELSAKAAGQLQYLHSRPGAAWALVLLGGPGIEKVLTASARLRGDILTAVDVAPLTGDTLIQTVRRMHPLFATADRDLLVQIDKQVCRGLLKVWARFLQIALDLRQRTVDAGKPEPVLDAKLAKAVNHYLPRLRTAGRS